MGCNYKYISNMSKYMISSTGGNFAIMGAIVLPILIVAAGGAVDVANAYAKKKDLQERLDAGVLSAAPQTNHSERQKRVEQFMSLGNSGGVENVPEGNGGGELVFGSGGLEVVTNPDGSVTANYSIGFRPTFLSMIGMHQMTLNVSSTAFAEMKPTSQTCIYSLTKEAMGLRINGGVDIQSKLCEVAVHSSQPNQDAFYMSSGSKVDTAKFCVKGTTYNNHAGSNNLTNFVPNCTPPSDPYANNRIPAPSTSGSCVTEGALNPGTYSLKPGKHCNTTFNGTSVVTFQPGLHIISGTMIVNSGSTINAEGVTFYFPNSDSELRANGGLTSKMSAPTSGTYKGILMFETPTKKQGTYIFNGSVSEQLEGVIYLPSRDVTFNSKTKQISKITLVVNSAILNPNEWRIEPYDGAGSSKASVPRLVR